ncbi:MAG: zeta toxin family protein [Veillonellaceae bacterium]|nr:zeta toxin family protein [Veillonellaceae bacterium]
MSLFSDKLLEAGQQAQWNSPVYDTQGVAPHYDVEKDEDAGTISKLGHRLLGGLEGFGGDALKGIGTYLDYLDEKGRESSYIDSIRDSDGGYLKDAGDWFINNGQYLSNDATTMRQKYGSGDKYADKSLGELLTDPDYLFSSDGAIGDAMEGTGSTLPFIALNYLIPGSGLVSRGLKGASGLDRIIYGLAKTPEARKEAMKILATGEGRETLAGLARQQGLNAGDNAARRAAMWALDKGAGTAGDNALKWAYSAGPMDALTNAAGMYDDLKEQGYSYEDMVKAMGTSAKEELPLDMLNMALFGTVTKGTVGNLLKGTAKPKKIIGNLLGLPIEGLSEDYQEAMQQRLNNKYTGKEYGTWDNPTPDEAAAGAQGFIGLLLPGAFGTGMGIRHSFKGQDDRATRIGTAWDNIRSLNGEPPMTNSAMDMIAEANASTNAKLAAENAAAQKAAEQASQPAFAVAQDEQAQESASPSYSVPSQALYQMTDGVNHDGFDEGTEAKLRLLDQYYAEQTGGDHLLVTSMRDGSHSDPNHAAGRAFDVANDALHDDDLRGKVIAKAQELGLRAYDEYDHSNWTENTTGDNLHLSDTGEPINVSMSDAGGGLTLSSGDQQIDAWIQEAADANGVPANLLSALLDVESGYNVDTPNSEAGAIGIAQFMPGTAEAMGIDPRDPHQAISGAARLLKQEYDHYGNWSQALEAYNGGEGNVGSGETQAYAQKVLGKAGDISHVGGGPRSSASTNFLNEKPSFDINSDDAEGRKMISDFIDYWGNRANVDDADTIQGMLDANGKFRNTQENRDTVREKWGDELQQYADEHMTDEQQAGQETKVQKQAQQQADAARRAAQGGKKAASADNTKAAIDTSTPSLDAAKQQQVSTTPQATSIDTAGESEQTQAEPAQSLPNTAHLQPNTEHPASEAAHPATAAQANAPAQAKAQQAQPTTQASQPTAQAAPIEQGKAPTVPKNETQNAEQSTQTPAQPQGPTLDAQQATKQQNALPQPAQTSQQATAQMSPAQQRARAAKEQRLQKELETNATLDQIERGQQLEAAAKQAGITLPQGMAGSLHRGQAPAIAQATELLQQKGVSLPTVEASGSTVYGKAESNNGWGSTERARFHRKLKKARAGLKKQKPKSKDERELVNSIDKAYQDIQDALEGLKNGTMSAKDAGHLIWKRHGEVASKWQNTKNKERYLGTRGAYENAFNDATTEVHYASVEAGEDNSRSTEEPTVDPVTSKQVMQGYRDAIDETVDDYYKGELTAEESRIEMERTLEKAQGEPESRAREEDQQAFDEYVTQKENEVAEDNRQKLDGHIRDLLRKGQKPFEEETKTPDTAATNVEAMAWIDAHPFRYDKNKSVDENIERGEAYARAFIKQFGTTDQIDTPERQALRERIADELYGKGAKKKEGKVWLIVGVPASGKSTIANPIQEKNGAMLIDADEAKEKLPEFAGGLLVGAVHEESSNIVSDVLKHAMEQKDNIVMPVVGKTYESLKHKIDRFKEAGYEVHLEYVDLPVEKATQRVKSRFVETGRLVSPKYLASVGLKPKENYDKLKVTEEVDSYEAWNNDVERGAAPLLIERSSQSKPQNSSGLGGRRDDGRSVRQGAGLRDRESEAEASNRVKPNTESRSDDQGGFSLAHLAEKAPVGGAVGKAVTVVTDKKTELHARYRIVPASSLTTSNVYDGDTIAKNDAYPQELQPRERSGRKEMQAQTDGMAADLHPADLEASRNLNQGAPLIRSDGVVLNGNGRTMAITRAYALRNKAGKRYTQYLIEHAEDFGFTKDQMRDAVKAKGTGKPVLVRELTDDADEATTQDIINSKTGGARMSATEQAETDAKSITSRDFDGYDAESDGDLTKAGNDGFVAKLLRKLVGKDEINAYTDANGSVNQDGYRRVKRAIFSRAYGDTDLIAKMAESMDDAIKNISNGLQSAAANVARLNLKMQEGNAYSYPLADTIARAVKKYNAIKEGKAEANVEAYANENETSLTGGDPEEVVKMVQALDDFHRSGKKIGAFLNHLADILDHQGSPKEDATALDFGEAAKPLTLSEAIDQAREKTVTGGEQDLFGAPKYSIEEAKERHERTLADLKREIASAFPGAKNVREDSDHIAFTMPNGSHLEIWTTDNIELSSEEEAQAKRDHGVTGDMHIKVNGYEVTVGKDAIIALSKAGEKGTAYHEVLHIAMDILFSDREKAALAKKFGKGRGTVEEHIAEAFRCYKLAREHGAHVPFGKLFQRIQDFFANLADHYKELRGTMTDADVARRAFRELANGKAWEKKPVDTRSGKADNETKKKFLIDSQKQDLFDSVSKRIQEYVNEQVHDGKSMDDVMKELTSENPTVRDHILARLNALDQTLNHMKTERSQEEKREFVDSHLAERFKKPEGLTDEEVNKLYESFQRTAKELKDYAGILFREISLNRRDHGGELAGMASWRDAENQRDTREAQAKNGAVNHGQHYSVSRSDSQDGFSRAKNPRKFAGEANADENPVDNRNGQNDNEGEERARFIDRLLNEKVPENGRTSIDSDVKDGIARFGKEITPENVEDVFDSLHCVRMLRATFNDNGRMQNYANGLDYAQKMAAYMYGYARRCFENDERIKRQLALRGTSVGRPAEVRDAHAEGRPGRAGEGTPRNGGQALQGTSLAKHGNVKALQELYDKLVDEAYHGKQYSVSRSDNQDGFSRAQNPRKYSIAYHGTQHEFDQFDVGKIGSGEGSQVHGWGIYFAKDRKISEGYRDLLTPQKTVQIDGKPYRIGDTALQRTVVDADGNEAPANIRYAVKALLDEGSKEKAIAALRQKSAATKLKGLAKQTREAADILQHQDVNVHQEGMLAEVSVPEDDVMLDEQKSGEEQPKSVRKALHAIVEDIQKSIDKMHEVDKVLADKSKSLDERLGFEAEDRDALLSDEKTLLNRVAAARTESDDKALGIYNWITMFEPLEDGRSGKEIYEKLSQLFGGDDRASRILNEYGIKGIKYNGHRDGDCYVVFDDKAVSIIRKLSASRAKEAHTRAVEDIKAEVLKAFPGAKDVKDTGDRITFTMPNGAKVAIRIHDNMTVSGEEASRARRAHGIADGVTITVNGSEYTIGRQAVIDLSQRGEVGTVYHEALHVAMDLLFDDKTKAALMKKYGSEEKMADAYRKFMLAEARGGHVPFGKPLRAIRDFFRALASHIAPIRKACGDAWTAQKAFEDLASGKAWEPASKKSHDFSLFSHAEAAERPIDNEAARGDNEVKKENQRIEQKNQKVFESVQKAFLNEVQKLRDKGWKETSIARAMNDENSAYRKAVVEPFARVYNQFHVKGSNKRDVVQRILGEKAFADLMQKNPTRRQEAIAEVFQQLSDRMEGVMNDARKTCIELADRFGNGQDVAGLHSWRDIEASSRKHHGGAAFTEHPAEVNHEQHHSVSRSETQDGFSDARKSGKEYMDAVDRYQTAATDEERAAALDDLRAMVQEAAENAGFHDAVPEQTVAYHTREGAAPKKTVKVYKVFTVSPDGSPTALFIGGTEKLPQGVWLDAQSAYHFQAANGKYYVPSTQNPYTKGGKTGASVEIPNEQVRQELIERGFLKPGSTAKKITALAYRPGWHAGTLPFFPQGGKKNAAAPYGMMHRENQVVFECELAADKNYTQEARSQAKALTKAGKLNPKNADLQYMPENGFYFYATNPLTQSHPELGAWAISGSLKINRALSQEECDTILEKNGMKPQAWEQGKMNLQDLGYTGEQNDAARKTLAPITYDDSGNVIPLSERFNPEKHDIRYSISEEESKERAKGWLHSVGDKLAKGLHLKGEKIMLEEDAKDPSRDINLKQYIAASPSRVAEKVKTFRVLYVMADRAMNKVVSLRDGFERKLNKALALASSKDDRQDLFDLLLRGDAEGKEWTRQELIDDGVKENVADAYIQIRRQLNRAYHLVNDARRKPTPKSETVGKDRLAFLKANKFVTDLSVKDKGDGKYLVSYKEYKNYPKTYKEVGADMVERFQHDPGIQVVDVKEAKTESGHAITDADGKPLYNVTTTEGPAELHKLKGYIPHFFHEYFLRVVDKDGNARTIGSARNQREAVMQAEAWMKDHKLADGETIHVQPKVFDINKALGVTDDDFAPVMGDKDFLRVQKNLAKQNDMTLAEAKDMLDGAVRLKGRHRFFGNALHRTGAAGFETDLDWALRHYFNSASRYVAMETEFKPKAISYFERVFGAFDKDYNNNLLAKYCKDYINDINGTPSSLEQAISKALNSTWLFKKVVIPTFGDRAALTLGNGIANKISYMTLGLNMSSALLNFSQLMNSAAYIGDVRSLGQMMRKGMHRQYSLGELRILKETGVLNDIGIDSGSGYDKLRGGGTPSLGTGKIARALTGVNRGVDFLGQKSMYFFQQADSICRRGTVLVAYEKARKEGKSHAEAIAYAKDVNNKANFQYGTQDAPNIFRRGSIVSQLALQFKKYGFKELEVMADFSPWSKKTSRKQKLMFWGMYALLCGAMGVPALDWLDEIFGEKTGFYTKDELQKAIIHLCGGNKRLAVSLMYGIPAAFNINLSSRAGMSDVIPTSLGDFAGPTISKSVRLAQDLLGGDYANALRDVNPGLYNLYAAGTGESRGKRDRLNDRYVTAWDRILRAVGFRSVDETIPTDMQRIISREKSAATKERQDAMDDYLKNPTSENKQRLKDFGIKEKDVQKEATKKNQTREERTQGTVPKKDKDKYKSLTDFMKE